MNIRATWARKTNVAFGIGIALGALAIAACSDDDTVAPTTNESATETPDATTSVPSQSETREDASAIPDASAPDATVANGKDAGDSAASTSTECTTSITANHDASFVELCKPTEGTVQHVRITGVQAPASHAYATVMFGLNAAPAAWNDALEPDQFRVVLYGGGGVVPPALVQGVFGSQKETLAGNGSFMHAVSTVCFDLRDGAAASAPTLAFWVDGQKGAKCSDRSTLTAASAYAVRSTWGDAVGAIDKSAKIFFGQTAGLPTSPTITLSSVPAIP